MDRGRPHVSPAGVLLVAGMLVYAALILLPLRLSARLRPRRPSVQPGSGPRFSLEGTGPTVLLTGPDPAAFDDMAGVYDMCVGPFARPLFSAALDALADRLGPRSRVLDVGCGPGAALVRVARLVPEGEVVGLDLSIRMLEVARERAYSSRVRNVALFQADAMRMPRRFEGMFDLAFSCLVHHHLTDQPAAVRGIAASLRPGGAYAAIDAVGPVLTRLASPLTKEVDPGWVGFPSRSVLLATLSEAGLTQTTWVDLAPGIGMAIGTRA